ncbi:hypothetical protein QAD02_022733 [Eretmocerus hayati]|uniref:Uncharacterized protein n=1 Tax=Eretmocerus hayati TaxID=131215 RepID=A0ACC2PUF8_9HYME|nr:hypothetical protein QAD02_022733 [Eretmocerus hayati]
MNDPHPHLQACSAVLDIAVLAKPESPGVYIIFTGYLLPAKPTPGGALLDSTKRGLPCGIEPPEPVKGPDGDKLASIAARFSYFQEKRPIIFAKTDQRRVNPPPRSKNSRPTVRLRPRQVLCSKCQSICNENSENVGRKRKLDESIRPEQPTRRSDRRCNSLQQQQQRHPQPPQHQQNTRSQRLLLQTNEQSDESSSSKTSSSTTTNSSRSGQRTTPSTNFGSSLIPKLSRLTPTEIGTAIHAGSAKSCAKLTEQRRSAFWDGRDEEADLEEAEAEVENRPINVMPQAEPVELDSNPSQTCRATPRRLSSSSVESAKIPLDEEDKKTLAAADSTVKSAGRAGRVTRKKRSIGLMEDLWDESVFEDPAKAAAITRATPVIKISFGAQGEGTVLKIPSKVQHQYQDGDTDNEEMQLEPERDPLELPENPDQIAHDEFPHNKFTSEECGQEHSDPQKFGSPFRDCETASSKAAKKALKKAKKKALKKMYEVVSPTRSPCNGSPRYYPNFEKLLFHRRKHKMKHKKKHKEERKHKSQSEPDAFEVTTADCTIARPLECPPSCPQSVVVDLDDQQAQDNSSSYITTAIKEQCLKQKLSISLKRLNTNAYAARCEHNGYAVSNASSGCKSPGVTSDEGDMDAGVEDDCLGQEVANGSETTPNFTPSEHPLVVRLAATAATVDSDCSSSVARRMDVGDVVWGKVHGFPWWPAKVLSITDDSYKEDGSPSGPQAHVAWYGSSTRSFMSCDQLSPFLETFKTRYNKKKKGPYKEAIRQAQNEARNQLAPDTAGNVLNVCGSPREVNVLS